MTKVKDNFTIKPEAFTFLMRRWADWNCAQALGANLGYPSSAEFVNTRVDHGGAIGARVLVSDYHDMEQIEAWVCSIANKNLDIAEAIRAHWEAKPIYQNKIQQQKAAIAGMKLRAYRDKFVAGNLMMTMAMEGARFRPDLSYEDVYGVTSTASR